MVNRSTHDRYGGRWAPRRGQAAGRDHGYAGIAGATAEWILERPAIPARPIATTFPTMDIPSSTSAWRLRVDG